MIVIFFSQILLNALRDILAEADCVLNIFFTKQLTLVNHGSSTSLIEE